MEREGGGVDARGRFVAIPAKGDNLCDFLVASLHAKLLIKRGLL